MSEYTPGSTNSLEIIQPFIDRIDDARDVQIMGGLGTAALVQSGVEILSSSKEIIAPEGFYLSAHREDGTLRDVDVLVLSSEADRVESIDTLLEASIGNNLERSVFGIRPHSALEAQLANPLGFRAFRTFLSDRYEASPDARGGYVKSLFPFSVTLPKEALETWTLIMGDDETRIPIPHPGTTLANYASRSISGLRPRDKDKITQVAENIFTLAPEIKEWLVDGPGKSQIELSTLIASLRNPDQADISLIDGLHVRTYSHDALVEHENFMIPDYSPRNKKSVIGRAVFKANGLHSFESNPWVVTLWRQLAERKASAIVKNS